MPTYSELSELVNKCEWNWMNLGGHNGYKIVGPNGNAIFLPAAGSTTFDSSEKDIFGLYWSSSVFKEKTMGSEYPYNKRLLFTKSKRTLSYGHGPQCRMSIRPVLK